MKKYHSNHLMKPLLALLMSMLALSFGLTSCFGQSLQPQYKEPSEAQQGETEESSENTTAPIEATKGLTKLTRPSSKLNKAETPEKDKSQGETEKEKNKKDKDKENKESLDYSQESEINLIQYVYNGDATHYAFAENTEATADLDAAVMNFLAERGLSGANISIVFDDLVNQTRYAYRPDVRYTAASVIKVPMAMVCAQLVDEGVFAPDMQIVYKPGEDFTADNLDSSRVGQMVSMQELVNSALLYSDNSATSVIFEYFRRQGSVLHQYMDVRTGTNYSNDVTISAREGIGLIEQLYLNQSSYPSYQGILNTMSGTSWQQFLTAGIPVSVSSKYGNLGAFNHEIGLVWGDHPFAYSVMTQGVNAYSVLPELGSLLYQYSQGQVAVVPVKESNNPMEESSQYVDEQYFPDDNPIVNNEPSQAVDSSDVYPSEQEPTESTAEESSESTSEVSTNNETIVLPSVPETEPNILGEDNSSRPGIFGESSESTFAGITTETTNSGVIIP